MPPRDPSRRNNFDALRLALATLVLFSHSYVLAGVEALEPIARWTHNQLDGGAVAVNGFFVISGYLITQSWLASETTDQFLRKRIRRIYPGFLAALLVSALIAAACSPTPVHYLKGVIYQSESLVRGVLLLGYGALDTKAAFPSNPYPGAVNGSLWTLQPELFCYLIVAGLGVLGILHRTRVVVVGAAIIYATYIVQVLRFHGGATDFTRLLVYFAAGAVIYCTRIELRRPAIVALCVAAIVGGMVVPPLLTILLPAAGAYALLSLAFAVRVRFDHIASKGDVSYGVYLYAFVVQQAVVATMPVRGHPLSLFAVALPVTYGCAWLSWHYVERRFIRRPNVPPVNHLRDSRMIVSAT